MGLLSKGLLEALKNAGVCEDAIDFDGAHTLAQWLEEHGIAASHPAIEKYFGLPYHALKRDAYLTVARAILCMCASGECGRESCFPCAVW